jgi:hypothetical protein
MTDGEDGRHANQRILQLKINSGEQDFCWLIKAGLRVWRWQKNSLIVF